MQGFEKNEHACNRATWREFLWFQIGGISVPETELTDEARLLLCTFEEITKLVAETPDFSVANLPASPLNRFCVETTDY